MAASAHLTGREVKRVETLLLLKHKMISAGEAQNLLKVSRSHLYRLLATYCREGPPGVVSKQRGQPSNRSLPPGLRKNILKIISDNYRDYGPTLTREMLMEVHGMKISTEKVRQLMIEAGIWIANRAMRKLHQPRKRMFAYGDLTQIDGSHHDWFESRAPVCCLMVMIDDATGRVQYLKFSPTEDAQAYYDATKGYLESHGKPLRIQTDKHRAVWSPDGPSHYAKALEQLNIIHSVAHTPQSKGRVERTHRTLQDRLVKALRRERISNLDDANAYLSQFIDQHNRKFGRVAPSDENHHRPLADMDEFEEAFAKKFVRRLSRALTFSFNGNRFMIHAESFRGSIQPSISIEVRYDGTMIVTQGGHRLEFSQID